MCERHDYAVKRAELRIVDRSIDPNTNRDGQERASGDALFARS